MKRRYSSQLEVKDFLMKMLSIGEVAQRTGIRASALRYYEDERILPPAARVNGRRCYDEAGVRRVGLLQFAQQAGFTLEEVRTLFHGFGTSTPLSARWRPLAQKKLQELEVLAAGVQRMQRALEIALECGCVSVEDCSLSPAAVAVDRKQGAPVKRACAC